MDDTRKYTCVYMYVHACLHTYKRLSPFLGKHILPPSPTSVRGKVFTALRLQFAKVAVMTPQFQ